MTFDNEQVQMKILILGGTREARLLARDLVALGHEVITSLAGRTQDPILPEGGVRMGRFGGVPGLCAYLRAAGIERLVDATHPYAGQMSINAVAASQETGIPLVRYMRPPWSQQEGQDWLPVHSAQEAADSLPSGANVLLTSGHTGLDSYRERVDCRFRVRLIVPPEIALPPHMEMIQTRPPYRLDEEIALMQRHEITHLVTKNSGGEQTQAKLVAAQQLGIKVLMIARPVYGPAREVDSIEEAIAALDIVAP